MERPTKPVMWTDREATNRINGWLESNGFMINDSSEIDGHQSFSVSYKDIVKLTYCSNLGAIKDELGYLLNGLNITPDSLLHNLNIIKPVGRLEYTSEWIDKILSGQKTMDILPVQHTCGYYELWDTDRQEVRGIVEVTAVFKYEFSMPRPHGSEKKGIIVHNCLVETVSDWDAWHKLNADIDSACGMTNQEFIAYHRTHFQSVKYAITYRVVDMKGDDNA